MSEKEPVRVLTLNTDLEQLAQEHAMYLGNTGEYTHMGKDGSTPSQRINKVLDWARVAAEAIEVGSKTPQDIVLSLIIDDGNEERSNRKVLFSPNLRQAGISCAPHRDFGIVTVVQAISAIKPS